MAALAPAFATKVAKVAEVAAGIAIAIAEWQTVDKWCSNRIGCNHFRSAADTADRRLCEYSQI